MVKTWMKNIQVLFKDYRKKTMSRRPGPAMARVYLQHWRWLQDQGPSYKQQASSCKRQAASLTRDLYSVTVSYKLKEKEL